MRKLLGWLYCLLSGWRPAEPPPELERCVIIFAPHTSNWDFPAGLALAWVFGLHRTRWIGKHTLFRFPFGLLVRLLGGLPVDRRSPRNTVEQIVEQFGQRRHLVLAIAPEGTRGYRDCWKSGFYRIALLSGVPIVPAYLDWSSKRGGFGPPLVPTGDTAADMERLRAFYAGKQGRYPEQVGPVRLAGH